MGGPRKQRVSETVKIAAHDGTAFLIARNNSAEKWRVYRAGTPGIVSTIAKTYDARAVEIDFTALCNLKYGGIKRILTETEVPKKEENWRCEDSSGCLHWRF